jgi:hypothetical protein
LHARLGRNYSLRRSIERPDRWLIEQKVSVAYEVPGSGDASYRLKHGLHLVLSTPDHSWIQCPKCFLTIALPLFETAEFKCAYCTSRGEKSRFSDGYFPLVDRTLTWLAQRHPKRARQRQAEILAENRAIEMAALRQRQNLAEDLALEAWGSFSEKPQSTGPKRAAPEFRA